MRKIRIIEHISLDGVIQAPGGPKEDGDYPHGGWAAPRFSRWPNAQTPGRAVAQHLKRPKHKENDYG